MSSRGARLLNQLGIRAPSVKTSKPKMHTGAVSESDDDDGCSSIAESEQLVLNSGWRDAMCDKENRKKTLGVRRSLNLEPKSLTQRSCSSTRAGASPEESSVGKKKPLTEVINKQKSSITEAPGNENLSPYALLRLKNVQETAEILKSNFNVEMSVLTGASASKAQEQSESSSCSGSLYSMSSSESDSSDSGDSSVSERLKKKRTKQKLSKPDPSTPVNLVQPAEKKKVSSDVSKKGTLRAATALKGSNSNKRTLFDSPSHHTPEPDSRGPSNLPGSKLFDSPSQPSCRRAAPLLSNGTAAEEGVNDVVPLPDVDCFMERTPQLDPQNNRVKLRNQKRDQQTLNESADAISLMHNSGSGKQAGPPNVIPTDERGVQASSSDSLLEKNGPADDTAEALSDGDLEDLQVMSTKPPTKRALKRERKRLRNSGQAYTSSSGKLISERKPKPIHLCKHNKCQEKIKPEDADGLCKEFWNLGSFDRQVQYASQLIEYKNPVRRRTRHEDSNKRRLLTIEYSVEINGKRKKVCKSTFLDIFCISETFVRNIYSKKINSVSGLVRNDARGRHAPKHKLSAEKEAAIEDHIKSFPSYVSHYSRSQTKSLYFPANLNYKKMYKLYKESGKPSVSYSVYKKYVKKTGKKFKKPSKDSCGKCDQFNLLINSSTNEEKKKEAQINLQLHQRKAEEAYELKRRFKMEVSTDEELCVLVYDLEQVLPLPLLRCGASYYLRQLNVFNLTVYDCRSKITNCFMWHEGEAPRNANVIASCMLRHILRFVPEGIKRLVIFSDSCVSQNRNSHLSAMYLVALQEHPSLESIDHIYLVPGHTHMEVDNKHSVIERFKNTLTSVESPEEWYEAVAQAGKQTYDERFPNGKFNVIKMKGNFYDFSLLLKGPLVKRDKTKSGANFNWLSTFWFRYSKSGNGCVEIKCAHNSEAYFDSVNFNRNKGHLPYLAPQLKKCFVTPQAISVAKKKDLLSLLPYLHEKHHAFFLALPTDQTILQDTDPDLPEEELYDF